jgi:toxin-antitoxin system PIN domain toxin
LILIDANLLLYATNVSSPQHATVRPWLDERLNGTARVGIPWPSLLAFLRIGTNRRIFDRPLTMDEAWRQVSEWLASEPVWIPSPTDRHAEVLARLLSSAGVTADLVPDAHLAALAIEHGLELCSADRDFARFPGLRWSNPMAR